MIESETFTTRRLAFEFVGVYPTILNKYLHGRFVLVPGINEPAKYGLTNYTPVREMTLDVGNIQEAEDIRFNGGFQEQNWAGYETLRVITPGDFAFVRWKDIRSEQNRDIFLVLIGTLIALGASTLIEGLRPSSELFIERHDRSAPGSH